MMIHVVMCIKLYMYGTNFTHTTVYHHFVKEVTLCVGNV